MKTRPISLRLAEQRLMAALYTFGAAQPANVMEHQRLEGLAAKKLAEPIPGMIGFFRLTEAGRLWIDRAKGLDTPAAAADPVATDRKRLDRGLGLADDQAA